jgi:PAS domain S-box-containing protein
MTKIVLSVQYDWRLVALAIAVALYSAHVAFGLGARIARSQGRKEIGWICCGAVTMGLGIWSSQCIGMMGMVLPVGVRYRVPVIGLSLLIAIASCAVALFVVTRKELSEPYLIGGSVALGGGIAAMHYLDMAAMQFAAQAAYNSGFVALSVAVAVLASGVALQLARLRDSAENAGRMRWLSACVLAIAVAATHYTAMAATSFRYVQSLAASAHSVSGSSLNIAGIALLTVAILVLSVMSSRVEQKFTLQRQLLLSEQERWQLVGSASLDGLFDFDLVSGYVFYSPRWKAMLGYGPDELDPSHDTWRRFLHPEDRQAAEDKLEQYLRSGQGAFEMEYRVCHRNGDVLWILARGQAVWDEHKKPVRIVGCHTDITSRKRSEDRLKLSESRYRGLFEANPLPSWIYSPQTLQIQDVNQAAMDYYGWSREQFLGLSVNSIGMPGSENEAAGAGEGLNGLQKTPWRLRRKNKAGIWVELSNYEIQGADAPAHLMIANDVTTHVVNQTKIERAKDRLETELEQKSEDLQEVEAQWQSLAEASSQLVWSALPDGRCDYVNHKWENYSGVPASQLFGTGWLETLHPADRAAVEEARLKALQSGEVYKLQYRIRSKGGSYSKFSAKIIPVRVAADKPITRWVGMSTATDNNELSDA